MKQDQTANTAKAAEYARQTLQLLAQRRLAPTPQNYQAVYEEVAKLQPQEAFPLRRLRHILGFMPAQKPVQRHLSAQLSAAIEAQDWVQLQAALVHYAHQAGHTAPLQPDMSQGLSIHTVDALPESLAEQMARLIENTVAALGAEDERTQEISFQLVDFLRISAPPLPALEQMLSNYSFRLSFLSQEQGQRTRGTQQLLSLAVKHLCSVAEQDPLLMSQAQLLQEACEQPWTLAQLDTIQFHLKNLLFRHFELQSNQSEAHESIKALLAHYASYMGQLSSQSEQYQEQLSRCAERIQESQHLDELAPLLQNVVDSGGRLARENQHTMAALQDLRDEAQKQEDRMQELSSALERLQDASRHDPATTALNTVGFEEALFAENERSQRHDPPSPWCIAVLHAHLSTEDSTALGLDVHDLSLRHITHAARSVLRAQDFIARTSEQHLVLLLPQCDLREAQQALALLQNELAVRPLLHVDSLIPISLSAGAVQAQAFEDPKETLERSAQALLQALRLGGYRVVLH